MIVEALLDKRSSGFPANSNIIVALTLAFKKGVRVRIAADLTIYRNMHEVLC